MALPNLLTVSPFVHGFVSAEPHKGLAATEGLLVCVQDMRTVFGLSVFRPPLPFQPPATVMTRGGGSQDLPLN